eukprot:3535290-Pleurochrysis_carterae.AAC.1
MRECGSECESECLSGQVSELAVRARCRKSCIQASTFSRFSSVQSTATQRVVGRVHVHAAPARRLPLAQKRGIFLSVLHLVLAPCCSLGHCARGLVSAFVPCGVAGRSAAVAAVFS